LPIQNNPIPYGEVDAASHYSIADYTYESDRSITTLPYYIDMRYGKANKFREHVLWYPPSFHTSLAIAAVFGGESDVPIFLANAILCSLIVLAVYFIMRRFFGFEAALISGIMLIFSMRDIMIYLWGQWPERMGFAYLPLILYCFYKYCTTYLKGENKPIYLYLMSLFLVINLFIHPMDFFHSIAALIIIGLFFLIKERKIFFNIKHVFIAIVLFLLIVSMFPLQSMNVIVRLRTDKGDSAAVGDLSRLVYWFKPQLDNPGVPQSYFFYKPMIGPYWTIPLLLLGILFLLLRRNKKDLVMLGWLVSLYIMIHLDVIGKGRVHRSLSGTTHIFYPLIVLGLLYLISLIPKINGYKNIIKYGLITSFIVFIFISIGIAANTSLKGAYTGISRLNPHQYEFTRWAMENIPEDAEMYHVGSISLAKSRWMWMVSQRFVGNYPDHSLDDYNISYIIIDYSDFAAVGHQDGLNLVQSWEQNLINNTKLYDKELIKVYEFEN
jgi:hypothetical protein